MELPRIDVAPLLDDPGSSDADRVAAQLDKACRELGFFTIVEPELTGSLLPVLDREARRFFAQPDEVKADVAMAVAGSAWRGWFPVDGELTSGRPTTRRASTSAGTTPRTIPASWPVRRFTAQTSTRRNHRGCGPPSTPGWTGPPRSVSP